MNLFGLLDPRVHRITVDGVRAYMLQHGWKVRRHPRGNAIIFACDPEDGGGEIVRFLPISEHFKDYLDRLLELLCALGEFEDRPPLDIVSDMLQLQESSFPAPNGNSTSRTRSKSHK